MLERLIQQHRDMYANDLRIDRLVARQPPTTIDPNTGELHVEPGAATGMPMSGRFLKYLGHPEGYGSDFPWSKAWWRLKAECRRTHPYHRAADRPYWRGSLCHQLVAFTVVRGFSIENAAKILRYDNPEPPLRAALEWIDASMDRQRELAERRAREDQGLMLTCQCGHGWPRHDSPTRVFGCEACECSRYNADAGKRAA